MSRVTKETSVDVAITIDGTGACSSRSSVPFLDHMLDQLASHGLFDVAVKASGDTWIDDHHTNEDVALALGTALARALGDRRGIVRFGDFSAPLDEALVHVVLDLSGRPHLSCDLRLPTERIGTYETQLVEHFFQSLVNTSGMTLHIRQLAGTNSHHIVEATFKAFARALRQACERDPRREGERRELEGRADAGVSVRKILEFLFLCRFFFFKRKKEKRASARERSSNRLLLLILSFLSLLRGLPRV